MYKWAMVRPLDICVSSVRLGFEVGDLSPVVLSSTHCIKVRTEESINKEKGSKGMEASSLYFRVKSLQVNHGV